MLIAVSRFDPLPIDLGLFEIAKANGHRERMIEPIVDVLRVGTEDDAIIVALPEVSITGFDLQGKESTGSAAIFDEFGSGDPIRNRRCLGDGL